MLFIKFEFMITSTLDGQRDKTQTWNFSYSLPTLKSLSSVSSFLFIRPILHFSLAASTLHFVPSNKIKKVL